MIYVLPCHVAILHIPRTGGCALNDSVAHDPRVVVHTGPPEEEHMQAWRARQLYPGCQCVAVMRSPWEIVASFWRLCVVLACSGDSYYLGKSLSFAGLVPFAKFVRHAVRMDLWSCRDVGGFWNWTADDQTEAIRWHPEVNAEILRRVELYDIGCPRSGETSHVGGVCWTPDLIACVADYCHADIEKFGFPLPDCLEMTSTEGI